jgi:hypothetical protein
MPSTRATQTDEDRDVPPAPPLTTTANTTRAERLSSGHWLVSTAPSPRQARAGRAGPGTAWLRPSALFTAIAVVLPPNAELLAPTPDRLESTPGGVRWRVVSLDGPGMLCTLTLLASRPARQTVAVAGEDAHA